MIPGYEVNKVLPFTPQAASVEGQDLALKI